MEKYVAPILRSVQCTSRAPMVYPRSKQHRRHKVRSQPSRRRVNHFLRPDTRREFVEDIAGAVAGIAFVGCDLAGAPLGALGPRFGHRKCLSLLSRCEDDADRSYLRLDVSEPPRYQRLSTG